MKQINLFTDTCIHVEKTQMFVQGIFCIFHTTMYVYNNVNIHEQLDKQTMGLREPRLLHD